MRRIWKDLISLNHYQISERQQKKLRNQGIDNLQMKISGNKNVLWNK